MNLLFILSVLTLIIGTHSSSYETPYKASTFGEGHEVVVVEDQTTTPNGIYVATSETYYSIHTPLLLKVGWTSVSVNENNISVLLEKGIFFFTTFSALSKKKRDLIIEIRSKFLASVTGLTLSTNFFQKGYSQKGYETLPSIGDNNYGRDQPYSYGENIANKQGIYQQYGRNVVPNYSCVPSSYYNLYDSPLNKTLNGDVYLLDLYGNILDIYSRSVSIYRKPGRSILYRDHRYFAYYRVNMPLSINRIILMGQHIIFVYNDLNVLVKASWQLNPAELELTITARNEIKKLSEVEYSAAKVNQAAEDDKTPEKEEFFEKVHKKVDEFFEPIVKPVVDKIEKKKEFLEDIHEKKKEFFEDIHEKKKEFFEGIHEKAADILEAKKTFVDNLNPFHDKSSKGEEVKN